MHGLTFNVLKLLMEADPQLFDECSAHHKEAYDEEEEPATELLGLENHGKNSEKHGKIVENRGK